MPALRLQMRRISGSLDSLEAATVALHGTAMAPALLAQVKLCQMPARQKCHLNPRAWVTGVQGCTD
jgi:hypothetical protein